ncbi:MAG: D-alanine--D-alanine ligase [Ruminococcus sp.]|nr:D-alanine--D-alanine ligase [Ruminococcus sp.]
MRIVVLAGGLSTERDVSISSGFLVAEALRKKGHNVVLLDVFTGYEESICDIDALFKQNYSFTDNYTVEKNRSDISEVIENRLDKSNKYIGTNVIEICNEADITFLALHGGEGENGQIQATLDLFGIKYTGSGYLGSALAMNKGITKGVLIQNKINTPKGEVFKNIEDAMNWNVFPCVVKPCCGGSSVGIAKAEDKDAYVIAVKDAFSFEKEIVVEQFVTGREFSVGLLGGKALPPIEIAPKSGFYDYTSKYQAGATVETCPADIDEATDKKLRSAAEEAYQALNLESYARIDFLLDENGVEYCLEANTLPGMTPTSLLPQEAAVEGIDYPELCEKIIEISLNKYETENKNGF